MGCHGKEVSITKSLGSNRNSYRLPAACTQMKTRCQAVETGVLTDMSVTVSLSVVTSLKRADGQNEEKYGDRVS